MKRIIKRLSLAIAALLVIGAIALALHYYFLDRSYQERLNAYKKTYAEQLSSLLAGSVSPQDEGDVHASLAYTLLDEVLATLVGPEWELSSGMTVTLSGLHFTAEHGTPLLELAGRLALGNGNTVEVRGVATLAPPASSDGRFVTRVQIVALEPTLTRQAYQLALHGFFGDLTRALSQQYLDKLPEIQLPLSQQFKVQVAGATTPLTFPAGEAGGSISGNLITPGFTLSDGLAVQRAIFLEDGLHLFLRLTSHDHAPAPSDARWAQLSPADRLAALQHKGTSYIAAINRTALNHLLEKVSELPPDARTVRFQSTGANGELWSYRNENRGPFGVGVISVTKANVHLDHPDSLSATVQLSNLSVQHTQGAITGIKVEVAVNARAQIKVWSNFGLPIGGGAGSSIGTDTSAVVKAEGSLLLKRDGENAMLMAALTKPDKAPFAVDIHLGPLGTQRINASVGVPHTPLFSTPIPTGLENKLEVKVAGTEISRVVHLTDLNVESSERAITVSGNIKLLDPSS